MPIDMLKPMFSAGQKILLLSAHTDDCEIAMGGTIAKMVDAGVEIHWLTFCNAWQSLPHGYTKNTLIDEQLEAAAALGVPKETLKVFDFPVRKFPEHRQAILEELILCRNKLQPDIIFCPSLCDTHQDHLTLATEAQRAFKSAVLLGYILPWNITHEVRNFFIQLSGENLEAKLQAIACYRSQAGRPYISKKVIESLAIAYGSMCLAEKAEAFELIRTVCK